MTTKVCPECYGPGYVLDFSGGVTKAVPCGTCNETGVVVVSEKRQEPVTMKLEEAISWAAEVLSEVKWLPHSRKSIEMLVAHAESTRWRELSKEQPTEEGYYLTWRPKIEDLCAEASVSWWSQDVGEYGWTGFADPAISHWQPRPMVGPDES